MSSKRKKRKSKSKSSSVSDNEVRSPEEKKARETVSTTALLDSSTDETEDASEMAQDMGAKVDKILNRIVDIDTKLKQLEEINSTISSLEKKFDKLDIRVRHLEENAKEAGSKVQILDDGLAELNKQVEEVKTANAQAKEDCEEKCKARFKVLEDKLLYAEVYSRRENLRFYGISEEKEVGNTCGVLKDFLENQLQVNASIIEFQRVHRVGKINEDERPRPIIARFLRYGDRDCIFSKAKDLKGTGFGVSADFPKEIVKRRKLLKEKMKDARKAGRRAFFSHTEPDKLYIDGVLNSL